MLDPGLWIRQGGGSMTLLLRVVLVLMGFFVCFLVSLHALCRTLLFMPQMTLSIYSGVIYKVYCRFLGWGLPPTQVFSNSKTQTLPLFLYTASLNKRLRLM